jgi:hypothetical protein
MLRTLKSLITKNRQKQQKHNQTLQTLQKNKPKTQCIRKLKPKTGTSNHGYPLKLQPNCKTLFNKIILIRNTQNVPYGCIQNASFLVIIISWFRGSCGRKSQLQPKKEHNTPELGDAKTCESVWNSSLFRHSDFSDSDGSGEHAAIK